MGKTEKRPNTEQRSYAQLTPDEKDAISHRGEALAVLEQKLPAFLNEAVPQGVLGEVSARIIIETKD